MEYRTWITEALRLHFEEHLPRVVAGRRPGVPKSTVCGMFVRFRNAGLSWPLPAGMSEQELDARLYVTHVSCCLTKESICCFVTWPKANLISQPGGKTDCEPSSHIIILVFALNIAA